ncbi:MAG TPA: HNH endonuclease [Thermobifida alba]|nr:HNH endonuclease [Thermobifida alba]
MTSPSLNYRRGRSGRPLARAKARLKREGSNTCWLCGRPIDLTLPTIHPMSWTLDHAIPLSLRPDLALDPSNHREAHRRCNSIRGNRTTTPFPQQANSRAW